MAWNFCDATFQPRIHCDYVSLDEHDVHNLIAADPAIRKRGFLAERFIKPPVCITVEFPCNINIHSIVVNAKVRKHKSDGFQIFTQSCQKRVSWLHLEPQTVPASTDGALSPIGKAFDREQGKFVFVNQQYHPRGTMVEFPLVSYPHDNCTQLTHHMTSFLSSASHVMVKITQTHGGSIPAIGSLEILGQPAASTPRNVMSELSMLAHELNMAKLSSGREHASTSGSTYSVGIDEDITNSVKDIVSLREDSKYFIGKTEVPTEFIDPISCEVMSLPVLLPSGNTIDQQTLDKHIASDASWGRQPTDPFTGISLGHSSRCQSVTNTALKARIDDFLLKKNIDITLVARTTGRQDRQCHNNFTSNQSDNVKTKGTNKRPTTDIDNTSYKSKRHKMNEMQSTAMEKVTNKTVESSQSVAKAASSGTSNHSVKSTSRINTSTSISHEDHLKDTLNASLSSALQGLPKYTGSKLMQDDKDHHTMCIFCRCQNPKYVMQCRHEICQECLLKKERTMVCALCDKICSKNSVSRNYHS